MVGAREERRDTGRELTTGYPSGMSYSSCLSSVLGRNSDHLPAGPGPYIHHTDLGVG